MGNSSHGALGVCPVGAAAIGIPSPPRRQPLRGGRTGADPDGPGHRSAWHHRPQGSHDASLGATSAAIGGGRVPTSRSAWSTGEKKGRFFSPPIRHWACTVSGWVEIYL